jgi:hypothetical protein
MEGRVGVAARLFVVLALAGAGFAVGYLVAPHHATTPAKVLSTKVAVRQGRAPAISIHGVTAAAIVPAIVASKTTRKESHHAPPRSRGTTTPQTGGGSAHTAGSHSSTVARGPQRQTTPPTTPTTKPRTRPTRPSFDDGFTQQNPADTSASTGSESSTP